MKRERTAEIEKLARYEVSDLKEIWKRIKRRDFSGHTGLAIKNSLFQFGATFVGKLGSLVFTIILARLLMPELFGLYSLALSTILMFGIFCDLGIGKTLVRFASNALGRRRRGLAKAYAFYLGKLKLVFISIAFLLILVSSKFLAENYYHKPIFLALLAGALYLAFVFLALLAGALYLAFVNLTGFLITLLQSVNYFKGLFYKELFFQILRLFIVPLAVLFSLKVSLSSSLITFLIILSLALAWFFTLIFTFFIVRRNADFLKAKKEGLVKKEKKQINKFLFAMSATVFSGVVFGYIDKVMLGHFVQAEFIGYYHAALSLIGSITPLISFATVLLPIFSRLEKERLERGFKKSVRLTLILAVAGVFGVLVAAPWIIKIAYGSAYLQATNLFRLFSLLIISGSLTAIYGAFFVSQGKPEIVARVLVISTVLNIILNYFLITSFLKFGEIYALYGAALATVISRWFYFLGLVGGRKANHLQSCS